ncbi:MAG: precorrin-2 C(20)-methyltransferase [Cyanobacteria bacterium J06638_28]
MEATQLGKLWGISVGPGDPELLTIKATRLLKTCPVVAFPAGRKGQPGMAERIVSGWLNPSQIQLPLYFPYVQAEDQLQAAWNAAAGTVWSYLAQGQDVVFATEGDASLYSTFTYLAQALQQTHPNVVIQTVPGVCSPLAAAAVLGKPLASLAQRLTILPALYTTEDLETAIERSDVVVLLKVASVYQGVWQILHKHQLLQHSSVIVQATQPEQQIYQGLEAYADLVLPYFSLLIIRCSKEIRLG